MWNDARQEAKSMGLRRCYWTGYVTEAESFETLQASCLVCATQREAARGLLWPSKLARIMPIDKPLLWIGPTTGAIAQSISGRPATGCFEPEAIASCTVGENVYSNHGRGIFLINQLMDKVEFRKNGTEIHMVKR